MPVTKSVKKTADSKNFLAPFQFHGLEFTEKGSNAVSDCPLCGKEQHFYVNSNTGQWDCKSCGAKGNTYTFLRKLLTAFQAESADLKKIALARRLPVEAFKSSPLGFDESLTRWLLPVFSPEKPDTLVGLRVWDNHSGPVLGTSGLPHHLLNAEDILSDQYPNIFICEGDWDWRALQWLLSKNGMESALAVGSPGASIFKKEWVKLFSGKNVFLCYDNDSPGFTGMNTAAEMVTPVANSVKIINWPSSTPEKYDLNDYVADRIKKPKEAWMELQGMFHEVSAEVAKEAAGHGTVEPKVYENIPTYPELLKEFNKYVHLDKDMKDALSIVLATVLSIKLPGDPIWMFLVGTPGSGKTLLLRSMQESEYAHYESNLRPHALVSGMRLDDGEDASLIPRLKGRCLVLKDYTEIRSQDRTNQEAIYGILRGAYDGHVRYTFGNGLIRDYPDCHFAMVGGVTHEIHGDNRASLGERFLKCEFLGDDHNANDHIRAAMDGLDKLSEKELVLRERVAAFLSRELTQQNMPTAPEWVKIRLIALAQIVAHFRTSVEYSNRGDVLYRPRAEIGTRVAKQLLKLGTCLAFVFGKKVIDKECYRLMEKVALDTGTGFQQDILRAVLTRSPKPTTVKEICQTTHLTRPTVDRRMQALLELKNIIRVPLKKPSAGQPELGYIASPNLVSLWSQAKIGVSR